MPFLTSTQVLELRDAFLQAFNRSDFEELVYAAFNDQLQNRVASGGLKSEMLALIQGSEHEGTTLDLLLEAERRRPRNTSLQDVILPVKRTLITDAATTMAPDQSAAEFQVKLQHVLRPELTFADVVLWRQGMERAERAVCRVELTQGTGEGTGFLVGADLVMTCAHVMGPVSAVDDVVMRFDHKRSPGTAPMQTVERRIASDRPDWQAAKNVGLDYVLLRLKPAEERPRVQFARESPKPDHPLQILQHPLTLPMKLAFGTLAPSSSSNVIAYNVNTEPGSSGSPVFNSDWGVVGLHRGEYAGRNQGTTAAAILADLEAQHLSGLLA